MRNDPEAVYREREALFAAERDEHGRRADRLSNGRLFAFTAGLLAALLAAGTEGREAAAFWTVAVGALLGFAALVALHRRARARRRLAEALRATAAAALARRLRRWEGLPVPGPVAAPVGHAYARDLDVLGRGSLLQLADACATEPGRARLADWLLAPAPAAEVRARQEAVRELADRLEWRDRLAAEGRLAPVPPDAPPAFLAWAAGEPWLAERVWLKVAAWLVPAATVGLAAAHLAGLVGRAWWVLPLLAAVAISIRTRGAVHGIFERAGAGERAAAALAPFLARVAGAGFRAERLADRAGALTEPADAARWMRRLGDLGALAGARHSMVHPVLQWGFLWDLHVLRALERWQAAAGPRVAAWTDALAEVDALAALGGLAHAHPEWAFPEVWEEEGPDAPGDPSAPHLEARALAHPLLPPAETVANDVTVGPPGSLLFVTGSNMAGKSTLLRAIGTNAVLARAGAPACAEALRLPELAVWTSMRVDDSVTEGVSHFLAELRRLKQVVDAARAAGQGSGGGNVSAETPAAGDERVLYLLDEPLQGTNATERRIAARRVLRMLLGAGAIGAVSTHDLELAEEGPLREAARPVHFEHRLAPGDREEPGLRFDYRLRPGLAPSTNALALMDRIGLTEPEGA